MGASVISEIVLLHLNLEGNNVADKLMDMDVDIRVTSIASNHW